MANYLINNMAEDKLDIKTNYYVLTYKIDRLDDMIALVLILEIEI